MDAYRRAGVDVAGAAKAVSLIREVAAGATRPEVADRIGGFAGLWRLGDGGLLAAAADGAGTKTEIARRVGRLDTIGIDLVAMSVNDVLCTGAEPLFFLDCVVVGRLEPEAVASIVEGVVEGCRRAGCALLGGETAEHPDVMEDDRFDLTGFCVGIVDEDRLLGPHRVSEGDVLVGLASSGLHCNGYSLVRRALLDSGAYRPDDVPTEIGRPLGDELLEPTIIYTKPVLALARAGHVNAAAHITGGGLLENIPRALPEGLGARIERGSWPEPPIYEVVQQAAAASDNEMFSTFNMGIGMVLAVPEAVLSEAISLAREAGATVSPIGSVVPGSGVELW